MGPILLLALGENSCVQALEVQRLPIRVLWVSVRAEHVSLPTRRYALRVNRFTRVSVYGIGRIV